MAALTAKVIGDKKKQLVITIDLETPRASASGKTMVVASSRGNCVTEAIVDGVPVIVGLNCFIKPEGKAKSA